MQHSLFWLLDHYPDTGESSASLYETALGQAEVADRLGFTSLWIAEHHFRTIGTAPNPAVVLAAIAQRTQQIRLGPAVAVLPLRHPIHVAEDYALVDVLSGGRLNLGVGSGSDPAEHAPFGLDFETRKVSFDHHLGDIRKRWQAAVAGERGNSAINVRPTQTPHPPIYIATMSPETAYRVGLEGDSLLTLVPPSAESVDGAAARIREHARGLRVAAKQDTPAESIAMMFAHVAESEEEVRATVAPALSRLMVNMGAPKPADPEALYEHMRRNDVGVFGTPDDVERQLDRLADRGIRHIAFISRFGGMSEDAALRSLEMLAPTAND